MAKPNPGPSPWCRHGSHDVCPHKFGGGSEGLRRRAVKLAVLCNCDCHSTCPVAGHRTVPDERWRESCTCPGSDAGRERESLVTARLEEQRRRMQAAIRDVDIRQGESADAIAAKLRAVMEAHELALNTDFNRISRFLAAAHGKRGTRTLRLLFEAASGLKAARRRGPGPQPGTDNAREISKMHRTLGLLLAAAMAAAILARTSTGGWRLLFAAIAAMLAALAVAFGLFTYLIGTMLRAAGNGVSG